MKCIRFQTVRILVCLLSIMLTCQLLRAEENPMYSAKQIKELRASARLAVEVPDGIPDGWSKSRVDPNRLLEFFPPLRVREGLTLRAYQFVENGNGNGVVWAMPEDAEFPEPDQCPRLENHLLKAPKPFDALDDNMEAIEGDDSPQSYLSASLLRRELKDFGALWHGQQWTWHTVLDSNPWKESPTPDEIEPSLDRPQSEASAWKWAQPKPLDWTPRVEMEAERVTVTFHTYCPLYEDSPVKALPAGESLYRHTDTYRRGKYRPRSTEQIIAKATGGVLP